MINLRKIGAIATGALFVGATFGMVAAAVTVPTAFQKTMLAEGGVAKAQFVIGTNAPGKTADKESADVIKNAVSAKLAVTGVGGKIKFSYYTEDTDGDGDPTNNRLCDVRLDGTYSACSSESLYVRTVTDKYFGLEGGLKFDGNNDGDLKDVEDYILYTGIYILDGTTSTMQFRLAYYAANVANLIGTNQKIKGDWYLVPDANAANGYVKMCPVVFVTNGSCESSQVIKLENRAENLMGYSKVYVGDDEIVGGKYKDAMFLMSDDYTLQLDQSIDIPGTYFNVNLDFRGNLKIRRGVGMQVTGGETRTPILGIREEATADKTMNLVLLGGPVANSMTAELVDAKKSTKDWYAGNGDIEIITDAYTKGKSVIIVAGKNRESTRAAAEALASVL